MEELTRITAKQILEIPRVLESRVDLEIMEAIERSVLEEAVETLAVAQIKILAEIATILVKIAVFVEDVVGQCMDSRIEAEVRDVMAHQGVNGRKREEQNGIKRRTRTSRFCN